MSIENATPTAPVQAYARDDPETLGAVLQLILELDGLRSENAALRREIDRRDSDLAWLTRQLATLDAGNQPHRIAQNGDANRGAKNCDGGWWRLFRKLLHVASRLWRGV